MHYLLVGGSAALIDLGDFVLLWEADFSTPAAATVSFAFAAVYNFALSSAVVFRLGSTWRRFMLFMILAFWAWS